MKAVQSRPKPAKTLNQTVDARSRGGHPAVSATAAAKASGQPVPLDEGDKSVLRSLFITRNEAEGRANQAMAIFQRHDANVGHFFEKICRERNLDPKQFKIAPDGGSLVPKPEEGKQSDRPKVDSDLVAQVAANITRRKKGDTSAQPSA